MFVVVGFGFDLRNVLLAYIILISKCRVPSALGGSELVNTGID